MVGRAEVPQSNDFNGLEKVGAEKTPLRRLGFFTRGLHRLSLKTRRDPAFKVFARRRGPAILGSGMASRLHGLPPLTTTTDVTRDHGFFDTCRTRGKGQADPGRNTLTGW